MLIISYKINEIFVCLFLRIEGNSIFLFLRNEGDSFFLFLFFRLI